MKLKSDIHSKNTVVKCGADFMLPFATMFGMFVILFGTCSSGGGFQGGVLVAAACILIYLGYGFETTRKSINMEFIRINEAIGAIIYVLLGLCGVLLGVRFCQNVFFENQPIGTLFSGGTITYMSYAVGYKVLTGVGFLLMSMMALLSPDDDEDEEAEEAL